MFTRSIIPHQMLPRSTRIAGPAGTRGVVVLPSGGARSSKAAANLRRGPCAFPLVAPVRPDSAGSAPFCSPFVTALGQGTRLGLALLSLAPAMHDIRVFLFLYTPFCSFYNDPLRNDFSHIFAPGRPLEGGKEDIGSAESGDDCLQALSARPPPALRPAALRPAVDPKMFVWI